VAKVSKDRCRELKQNIEGTTTRPKRMSEKDQIVIAFDLYGTLLSTESIANELARHFGQEKAASLAALWRRYQLEYTWRLNSMSMKSHALSHQSPHRLTLLKTNTSPSHP